MATYTVVLQDPKTGPRTADLIWVPEHDRRRGANVITTLTAPHSFSPARLAELRQALPPDRIAALPPPRVAVVLGGKNGVYRFTEADDDRFEASLRSLRWPRRKLSHHILAPHAPAPARLRPRVPPKALRASSGTAAGDNPYPAFLAHADHFIVTADSVNMTGEPCATGRPVWVFEPSGGSAKFRRFHDALRRYGATRPLPETVSSSRDVGLHATRFGAARSPREIERRWLARRRMLGPERRRWDWQPAEVGSGPARQEA